MFPHRGPGVPATSNFARPQSLAPAVGDAEISDGTSRGAAGVARIGLAAILAAALAAGLPAAAQQQPAPSPNVSQEQSARPAAPDLPQAGTSEITVGVVEITPDVFDSNGVRTGTLKRRDFIVYDRDQRVTISDFQVEELPLTLSLVLDVSASMEERLDLLRAGARRVIEAQRPGDHLTLYAVNHRLARWSQDEVGMDRLRAAADTIETGGSTRLDDALLKILDEIRQASGRRAVLVMTDSRGGASLHTSGEVQQAASEAAVPIYVAVVDVDDNRPLKKRDLRGLARSTGGEVRRIVRQGGFDAFLDRLLKSQRVRYVLRFIPAPGPDGFRPLQVEVKGSGMRVECRPGYVHGPAGES